MRGSVLGARPRVEVCDGRTKLRMAWVRLSKAFAMAAAGVRDSHPRRASSAGSRPPIVELTSAGGTQVALEQVAACVQRRGAQGRPRRPTRPRAR